ncbi:PKD domain-containing protein [Pseudonocardiaceae bacterium YIM PH 21723]|nr:PKD domain-containing protein [Pseudonocardiaceae bacterium YIM PH 21723]
MRLWFRRRRTRAAASLGLAAALVGATLALGGSGDPHAPGIRLRSGELWLASGKAGQLTLVNGPSAEVSSRVEVAPPESGLRTSTVDGTAFAVNTRAGELSRIDGATHQVSHARAPGATALFAGPQDVYTVDTEHGVVDRYDPATLAHRGDPERIGEISAPVLDTAGRLWTITADHGDLVWFQSGTRRSLAAATTPGKSAVTVAAGRPAIVDSKRGVAELLNPDTGKMIRSARADLRPADHLAVGGSAERSRVLIAVSNRNLLVNCDFSDTDCRPPIAVGEQGSDLGAPVELGGVTLVPDYGLGRVWLVDLASARVVEQRQLFDHPVRFELIAKDGWVFYNDPDGELAGVFDPQGAVHQITKYNPERPKEGVAETPGQGGEPGTRPGDPAEVASVGSPRGTVGPAGPGGGSAPVSIVITPRAQAAVGEELGLAVRTTEPIGSVAWDFGDGATGGGPTLRHAWMRPGGYTVTATVNSPRGRLSTATATVTVQDPQEPPRVNGISTDPASPVIGQPVRFTADVSGASPERWQWVATGNGQEFRSSDQEFRQTFGSAGTYSVILTAIRGTATSSRTIELTVRIGQVLSWTGYSSTELKGPPPAPMSSGVTALAGSGGGDFLALKADGTVTGWGRSSTGQDGIPAGLTGVIQVSTSPGQNLALLANGEVVGWGPDSGTIPGEAKRDVVAISAAENFSTALTVSGRAIIWPGKRRDPRIEPLLAPPPDEVKHDIIGIAADISRVLLLRRDGAVLDWRGESVRLVVKPETGIVRLDEPPFGIAANGLFYLITDSPNPMPSQEKAISLACGAYVREDGSIRELESHDSPPPSGVRARALAWGPGPTCLILT